MKLRCEELSLDYEIQLGSNLVGRNEDCAIVLPRDATGVSRKHAEFKLENDLLQVRDMESRNGTELNAVSLKSLEWNVVRPGDLIGICDYTFRVVDSRYPDESHGSCIIIESDFPDSPDDTSSIAMSSHSLFNMPGIKPVDQLHALIRVTNTLRGILNSREVLEEAAKLLHQIFANTERAVIGTVDEEGNIEPRWWHLRHTNAESTINLSSTIVKQVIATNEALLSQDASRQFHDADSIPALEIKAVMCAPLVGEDDKVVGFVYVDTSTQTKFEESDLAILAAVATQISLALGYSRMHESVVQDQVLRQDLERARMVQTQYLPVESPVVPGYEISFFYRAARQIGGDYFDSIPISDQKHLFVLGDVEGKGAPAALTMVRLASETRAGAEISDTPAALLNRLNQRMTEKWITFVAVQLDFQNHLAKISNAAQEYPVFMNADNAFVELTEKTGGFAFSVCLEEKYQQEELNFGIGDTLILYSDGFPDAASESGERFGKKRLFEHIRSYGSDAANMANLLCNAVDEFRGSVEQFGDMCMICIQRVS